MHWRVNIAFSLHFSSLVFRLESFQEVWIISCPLLSFICIQESTLHFDNIFYFSGHCLGWESFQDSWSTPSRCQYKTTVLNPYPLQLSELSAKGKFFSKTLGTMIDLTHLWPKNLTKIWIPFLTCFLLVEKVDKMASFNLQLHSIYLYFIHLKN